MPDENAVRAWLADVQPPLRPAVDAVRDLVKTASLVEQALADGPAEVAARHRRR